MDFDDVVLDDYNFDPPSEPVTETKEDTTTNDSTQKEKIVKKKLDDNL